MDEQTEIFINYLKKKGQDNLSAKDFQEEIKLIHINKHPDFPSEERKVRILKYEAQNGKKYQSCFLVD